MKKIIQQFNELTLDQKRYILTGGICLLLLLVYTVSHVSETPAHIVEIAKNSDFKNGNLTVDETSNFYKRKDDLARKQYEKVLETQREIAGKLAEMEKKMEEPKTTAQASVGNPPTTEQIVGNQVSNSGDIGKKQSRRGQSQSKTPFLSDIQTQV